MHVCIYTYINITYIHICVNVMCLYMNIYTYVCIQIYMYICKCIHKYIYINIFFMFDLHRLIVASHLNQRCRVNDKKSMH